MNIGDINATKICFCVMVNVIGSVQTFYYRPQRSCGKVIFSEACVKNSVWDGACMAGVCAWQGAA